MMNYWRWVQQNGVDLLVVYAAIDMTVHAILSTANCGREKVKK
jgi:hypothetical protein